MDMGQQGSEMRCWLRGIGVVILAVSLLGAEGQAGNTGTALKGVHAVQSPGPANGSVDDEVAEVYRRVEQTLRGAGGVYHAVIQVDVEHPYITYAGTTEQWIDPQRNVAREEADVGPAGRQTTLLTEEARYARQPDGRIVTTPGRLWVCYGVGVAASFVLGCPGSTEQSTTRVEQGRYGDRPAVVLVKSGTMSGSDERVTFTSRLYLDPATYLPMASETTGQVDFGQVQPMRARSVHRHEFLSPAALAADFFEPAALGYTRPDPAALLDQTPPDFPVYWLGTQLATAAGLPPLVLTRVDAADERAGPGYRFLLHYARGDDPFGPPLVVLQLWPRAAWEAFLAQSRGMNNWDNPCWQREQLAVPDGQATLFSGHRSAMVSLPPGPPPSQACPARPYDSFVAHAYLDEAVVFVTPMAPAPRPGSSAANPYDTREGIELLVRALRRR